MRILALLSVFLVTSFIALPNAVLAQTITVIQPFRLLKFRGSLRLACYVDGQELLIGRTTPTPNPHTGVLVDVFESMGVTWVKQQRVIFGKEVRTIRAKLRRATGSRRTALQRELRSATRNYQKVLNQTNAALGAPCRNHHANVLGIISVPPMPTPTPTPNENPDEEVLNLEENIFGLKTYDPHGLALIPPRYDTTILFVDSLNGDDATNNGFTEEGAFRTVGQALQYLSSIAVGGRVNAQVYLKRGGAYIIPALTLSGRDPQAPLVFGAYGEFESGRPHVAPIALSGSLTNLAFSDLLFEAPSAGTGIAIEVTGTVENMLVQNCRISGFRDGIVVAGAAQSKELSIFRNVITDLSSNSGPSYGVKLHNIDRAIVSSNIFDRIGQSAASGFVPTEESTAVSITNSEKGGVVRGNQIFRSPTGIVLIGNSDISMAHLHANAIVRTGVAGTVDTRGVYIGENAVIEGTDIGSLNRGYGLHVRNAMAVQVYRNVIANSVSSITPHDYAMKFSGVAHFGFYDVAGLDIYNAADLHVGGFTWDSNRIPFSLAFKDSSIQNTRTDGANEPLVTLQGIAASVLKTDFRRLKLHNPADSSQRFYRIIEDGTIVNVNQLRRWRWFRWQCYGLELRVSPNLRMPSNNWYAGFEIHQDVVHAANQHFVPNRFRFNQCLSGYHIGPYTAQQRVTRPKWIQYADDPDSVHAPTTYLNPQRSVAQMLAVNNVPGTTLSDYIGHVASSDRGNLDYRFVGQRLAQFIRGGFNRQ